MQTLQHIRPTAPMILGARNAADLMTPNPVSIRHNSTITDAAAFLAGRGISAAPVIDEAGRPLGVVSRTDILNHQSKANLPEPLQQDQWLQQSRPRGNLARPEEANRVTSLGAGFLPVFRIMTPAVFCVAPETPSAKVVEKMLIFGVRRLFVVDGDGILIGVISPTDVLRRLRHPERGGNVIRAAAERPESFSRSPQQRRSR